MKTICETCGQPLPQKEDPEIRHEITIRIGRSYFGSGGYSAGYRTISGKTTKTLIPNSDEDNGFMSRASYIIRPETDTATIECWDGDGISSSGWRSLGCNGTFTLTK